MLSMLMHKAQQQHHFYYYLTPHPQHAERISLSANIKLTFFDVQLI